MEARLAKIWAKLLGISPPGRDESFFELGGHSLLATRLLSRLRQTFGVDLPLRAVFEAPTVSGLAALIDVAQASETAEELPLVRAGVTTAPLSFAQERLWFLDRLQPGSPLYNLPAVLRLTGALATGALQQSFTEIVRRHSVLRTTFIEEDDETLQSISPAGIVPLPVVDLAGLPAESRDREAERLIAREAGGAFDLARGPLLRLLLLRHDSGRCDHTLVVNVHHIVSDGWSLGVLVQESTVLYQAFAQGLPSPLSELPVQYADFSSWQRRRLSGPTLEGQLDFWRRELAGAPALLDLPTDRPRPPVQSNRGAVIWLTLPAAAAAAVHTLAQQEGATPFMVLLAAFQALLRRYSGSDDVVVGSPVANRSRPEIEGLIGFFANTQIFRQRFRGGDSFRAVLGRVRAASLASHQHQELPFELLVDALGVPRSLAHNPVFQVMLSLQNAPAGELRVPGLTFSPVEAPRTTAKFDLSLSLVEADQGFVGTLEYATDLFQSSTVQRFLLHFGNLLVAAAAAPEADLSELCLMDAAEERLLRQDLNRAERKRALPLTVHDRRTSENNAAIGSPGVVTHRELDERSNQLAGLIRRITG
jgi:acyl carrier protein